VSPNGLQAGARRVADANRILQIEVDASSSLESYLAEYLGQRFLGVTLTELAELDDETTASLAHSHSVVEQCDLRDKCDAQVVRAKPPAE